MALSGKDELNGHMVNLKYFRYLRKYSIMKFCNDIGVKKDQYAKWENLRCDPDIPTMIAIANSLHVSIDALVGRQIGKYSYQKELSNLLFGINTQFELIQHELELADQCCFEIGNLRVNIKPREICTEDRDIPSKEELKEVLKEGKKFDKKMEKLEAEEENSSIDACNP